LGIISDLMLGYALTKLTTIHEVIIAERARGPIGAGGIDSLPEHKQRLLELDYLKWMGKLGKYPRHKVTHALLKNMQIAQAIGSDIRMQALAELFEVLVRERLALDVDTYSASYAD
jgi:hypothetical protein